MFLHTVQTCVLKSTYACLFCFILICSSVAIAEYSDADFLVKNSIDLHSINLQSIGEISRMAEASEFIQVADASAEDGQSDAQMSEICRQFAADRHADVGEVVKAGCEPTLEQMSYLMDNPLGNVAMLFTQFDWTRLRHGGNKETANQGVYTGILQFPKPVSENYNLISRVVWTVPSLPISQRKVDRLGNTSGGFPPGGGPVTPPDREIAPINFLDGRTTDFGDMYYVGLFSPKEPTRLANGALALWGLGFDLALPTAQEEILGSGKYSAGPSALAVYLGETFKGGALIQHYWDFASHDKGRDDVNLTNIQSIYYWGLNPTTSIGAGPNIIMNWEEDSDNFLTLPIGTGITKTIQFGKVPVRIGAELHYAVIRPDDEIGSDWNFRFYIIPAVPSVFIPILN